MNKRLITQIYNGFITDLEEKANNGFENLDKTLFVMADLSDTNAKQIHYLDSLQRIRNAKDSSLEDFLNTIKLVFESFINNQFDFIDDNKDNIHEDNTLSLVDNNKLEESLIKSNLIKKSEAAYHKHLFAFTKRFSKISNNPNLKIHQIPVGPHVLIHSYEQCIKKMAIDIDIKIIMYKTFEMSVMGQMTGIYTELNNIFIDNGIVPEMQYDYSKNKTRSSLYGNLKSTNGGNDKSQEKRKSVIKDINQSTKNEGVSPHQKNLDENYQIITQLLRLGRQVSMNNMQRRVTNSSRNFQTNIEIQSVINALKIMQNSFVSDLNFQHKIQKSPIDIKQKLIQQMHKMDSSTVKKNVRQADEDTIDLVGLLFQFIVEDRNLPKAIQTLLGKLQLPYLKIALQDKNIFADKNHEARKLLDKLAVSSIGWSKDTDSHNKFYCKLEEIINHILEVEDYNHRVFEILQINFDVFLTKRNKKFDVVTKRTNERAAGDAKIKFAKQQTASLMLIKMQNKPLPTELIDILLNEWSSILILAHLRFSEDSAELKQLLGFIDAVIEHTSFDEIPNKSSINKLLSVYEAGLKLIVFHKNDLIGKKLKLHSLLDNLVFSTDTQYQHDLFQAENHLDQDNEILSLMKAISQKHYDMKDLVIDQKYFQIVSSLQIGAWIIFTDKDYHTIRAKLSWINPESFSYLFVNVRGFKIIEKTAQQLAIGIQDKSVNIIRQVALFDRALLSIADKYKNNLNHNN